MQAEQKKQTTQPQERKKSTTVRVLKWLSALLAIAVSLVLFAVPSFVSSGKGREIILSQVNKYVDGKTDFASLSLSWFRGVRVTELSFDDAAGQTSVRVKKIATKPHYAALLTGNVSFGQTVIDQPNVRMNIKDQPTTKPKPPGSEPATPALPVNRIDLTVKDGSFKVTDPKTKTIQLSNINSELKLRPPGQQTDFDVSMTVAAEAGQSNIHAAGKITPKKETGWSLKGTSGNLTVEVNDLDLGSLAPLFALAGVDAEAKGRVSAHLRSQIKDGRFETVNAQVKGQNLDVTTKQLKGDRFRSETLDANVKLAQQQKTVNIEKLDIKADWLKAQLTGAVPTTFASFTEFLASDASLSGSFDLDVAQMLTQMPKTFGVKEDMKVTSGRLAGNVQTSTKAGKRQINAQANLADLKGTLAEKTIALSQPLIANAQITSDKDKITFDKLDIAASFAKLNCTGSTQSLDYTADISLAKLQSELGQFVDIGPYEMAGDLSTKGRLSIKEDKIAAAGSSTVQNLRLSSKEKEGVSASEPKAELSFSVTVEPNQSIVNIHSLQANATLGQVNVKDALVPLNEKAAKPMVLPVSAANLDLAKLQPFAVLFASVPKDMQLSGIAQSDLSIRADKDTYHIATDSTKIKNLKVTYPEQQPFERKEVSLVAKVAINPSEEAFTAEKLQLVTEQINVDFASANVSTKNGKRKLQGEVDLAYDWSALTTLAAPYLPKGLQLQGQRKDTITFSSEYPADETDKLLANLNANAKFGFEKAHYMGLNFDTTEVPIAVKSGLLTIPPFSTNVNGGKLNLAANIDLKQKPMVLTTPEPIQIIDKVNINDEVSRQLLTYLNPIFANQTNVTGIANFHCEKLSLPLGGQTKDALELVGTVGLDDVRVKAMGLLAAIMAKAKARPEVNLTLLPTLFKLQKDMLSYDNMQINIDEYPLKFSGSIGPDVQAPGRLDKILDMMVTTPYIITSDAKIRTIKVGEESTGQPIALPLRGTLYRPDFGLDNLLQELLKTFLQRQLGDRLFERLERPRQ